MVINSLVAGKHAAFRASKLTRLLSDALGGNSKTSLIVTASPARYNEDETVSTLRFGYRAKRIKNKAIVNEELSIAEYKKLLQRSEKRNEILKKQITTLQAQLSIVCKEAKSKNINVDMLLSSVKHSSTMSMASKAMLVPNGANNNAKQIELLQNELEQSRNEILQCKELLEKSKEELQDKIQDELLARQQISEFEKEISELKSLRSANQQLIVTQAALKGLQTQKQQWEQYKHETKIQIAKLEKEQKQSTDIRDQLTKYKEMAANYKNTSDAFEKELSKCLENPAYLKNATKQMALIKSAKKQFALINGGSGDDDDDDGSSGVSVLVTNELMLNNSNLNDQQATQFKLLYHLSEKLQEKCKKYEREHKKLNSKIRMAKKKEEVNKQLRENWNKQLEQMSAAVLLANDIYHKERITNEHKLEQKNLEIMKLRKLIIGLTRANKKQRIDAKRNSNNNNNNNNVGNGNNNNDDTDDIVARHVRAVADDEIVGRPTSKSLYGQARFRRTIKKVAGAPVTQKRTVIVPRRNEESKVDVI